MEFQGNLLAVEVAVKVQNPGLHGDAHAADGGAGAHIGDGGIGLAVDGDTAGIDAEFRHHQSLFQTDVGGGDAQGPAQLLAGDHHAGDDVGMAQETLGGLHIAALDLGADIGGGNALAVHGLLRDDGAGQAPLLTEFHKSLDISLVTAAEPEVVAADEAHSALLQKAREEFLPGHAHDLRDHGVLLHVGDAVAAQQQAPAGGGTDEGRGILGEEGTGMTVKGNGRRLGPGRFRQRHAGPQQSLMAQMYPIKKSQGKDSFLLFHGLSSNCGLSQYL